MSSETDLLAALGVEILAWPQDADRLEVLRAAGVPRLVMVPADEEAPLLDGELEDWVRLPADGHECALRARRLARLASEHRAAELRVP